MHRTWAAVAEACPRSGRAGRHAGRAKHRGAGGRHTAGVEGGPLLLAQAQSQTASTPCHAPRQCSHIAGPLQIFTERPEVHRAFLAHVPHNLDEKAFWTRYFKQQYRRMARRWAERWWSCDALLGRLNAAAGAHAG